MNDLIPPARFGGRPRSVEISEILNAVFHVLRAGSARGDCCRTLSRVGKPVIITGANDGSADCVKE